MTLHSSGAASPGRRIGAIALWAVAMLVCFELALQLRAQMLVGRSAFDHLTGNTRFAVDRRTGLTLLRPNRVFADSVVVIRTNSLGLRSPEIRPERTSGSLRIAIVGASTVMGLVAATNEHTFSHLLQSRLRASFPGRTVEVINGGVAGYGLKEQRLLLERLLLPLKPDLVIAYTGVNDFQNYCKSTAVQGAGPARHREGLPLVSLPPWLLSVRVLQRKTAMLLPAPPLAARVRDPYAIDLKPYRARLEALAKKVLEVHAGLVLVTNTRAYRREQPLDEQERLAATERRQTPCFDVAGLHALYERHNEVIRDAGEHMHVPVLRLDRRMPGGERYFVDSTHLSAEGERIVADEIYAFLMARKLVRF